MKKTIVASIKFENEPLLITDPCYIKEFSDDDVWSDFCDVMYGDKKVSRNVPYEDSYIRKDFYDRFVNHNTEDISDFIKNMMKYEETHYNPERVLSYYCERPNFICSTTAVGDWMCGVKDDNNKVIGTFGADAGFVCVCNANDYHLESEESNWLCTRIDNYTGIVDIVIYEYEPDDDGYVEPIEPNGIINVNNMPNYFICVEGHGNINFKSYSGYTED